MSQVSRVQSGGAEAPQDQSYGQPLPASSVDHATARRIMFGIMLAMFLSALEQTIVAPALPTIGRSFADIENLSWVVTAYLVSTTVATPLFGKLSDIYGRRRLMLVSVGVFVLGSVACALAPSLWALVLARALQGLGGGGILPLAQTVIADLVSPRERPLVQSYSSVMFMAASILGPVLGGLLTDYVHWSLIFWINVPLGAGALLMTERALRRLPRHERPHRLDMLGALLMVGAAVALLMALSWGGKRYPWLSAEIVALVGASAVLWVLLGLRLAKAPEPFIPIAMVRQPVVAGIVVAGFFGIGTIIGLSIFVPLYVELVLHQSASASGMVLIAFASGATLGSLIAGRLFSRLDRYKRVPIVGIPFGILGLVVLAVWPDRFSPASVAVLLTFTGLGMGTMYPTTTVIIQNAVLTHQLGTATGLLNFFRQLGGAIVVAVFGAIVLGGIGAAGVHTLDELSGAAGTVDFAMPFRWVFIAATIFLSAALIAILVIEERPLRGPSPWPRAAGDAPAGKLAAR